MADTAQLLFDYLRDILYNPAKAKLNLEQLDPEYRDLGKGMQFLASCVQEQRALAEALAEGNITAPPPSSGNELAAPLKSLQASLKHLSWQTQRVAKGDYHQRVDFMGEFSEAFNTMVTQLEHRQNTMMELLEERTQEVQRLENFAYNDALTKIHNRFYGITTLRDWVENHEHFSLIMIDLDFLKRVNDSLGHSEGDRYIVLVANELAQFRQEGVACRLGGDEFMIMAKGMEYQDAEQKMKEMRGRLLEFKDRGITSYPCSISYGIVEVGKDNESPVGDLLSIVDERMYAFKRAKRAARV